MAKPKDIYLTRSFIIEEAMHPAILSGQILRGVLCLGRLAWQGRHGAETSGGGGKVCLTGSSKNTKPPLAKELAELSCCSLVCQRSCL